MAYSDNKTEVLSAIGLASGKYLLAGAAVGATAETAA
jgi:hypothetical protein